MTYSCLVAVKGLRHESRHACRGYLISGETVINKDYEHNYCDDSRQLRWELSVPPVVNQVPIIYSGLYRLIFSL